MVCAWKFRVEVGEEVGPEEYFNSFAVMRNYIAHTCVGVGARLLGITRVEDTPYNNNIILLCLANSIY